MRIQIAGRSKHLLQLKKIIKEQKNIPRCFSEPGLCFYVFFIFYFFCQSSR